MEMKMKPTLLAAIILLVLASLLPGPANAQGNGAAAPYPAGPGDPVEMEAFLGGLIAQQMEDLHIAGAAVSVVKDGELIFARGYGYADLEEGIPVDPGQTLFKIGSITKLFTWTAVMQLVEQGKLDIDADVNTYLDFRIPDTYPQPVTLKYLMTHTAGFEDLHAGMVALDEENLAPPGKWLPANIPARVRPPGEVAAYSNYGAALAGYIVARVSGQSFGRYVQEHILAPLGMEGATAEWPAPAALTARESVGYLYADGGYQEFPLLFSPEDLHPAGGIRATAADMARFMIAHLQDGFYGGEAAGVRILKEDTARQMRRTLYAPHPRMLGSAYGFFEFSDNGQRVIGHSGGAEPIESLLLLLPDQNVGVFVAYNSLGAGELNRQHFGFQRAFFDHYYPAAAVEPARPPAGFAARAERFTGVYQWTMRSHTTFEKFFALTGPAVTVTNPGDGALLLESPFGDWRIIEEDTLYFRMEDGPYHFAFREDEQGRIAYLFTDLTPMMAFEKMAWYETPGFNLPLALACTLVFLSALPAALAGLITRRRRNAGREPEPFHARAAARLIVWISVLNLLFVAGSVLLGEQLVFGVPPAFKVVLGLGVLSALLTAAAVFYAALAWKERLWSAGFRAWYTLVTAAAVAFVWFLNHWNLLGWRF